MGEPPIVHMAPGNALRLGGEVVQQGLVVPGDRAARQDGQVSSKLFEKRKKNAFFTFFGGL